VASAIFDTPAIPGMVRWLDADAMVVRHLIAADLWHVLSMREAADRLHITERILRRRLAESGARYRELCDRVRERHATMLLQEDQSRSYSSWRRSQLMAGPSARPRGCSQSS
jgi:hypothetical protein